MHSIPTIKVWFTNYSFKQEKKNRRKRRAYIIKSSAKLSQQINQIMAQYPLLPNAVKPLSASLDVHHFPVTHLHLRHNTHTRSSIYVPHTRHATKSKRKKTKILTSSENR